MPERSLRVSRIKDGTVIDHVTSGHALDVVRILGITREIVSVVTIAMNVPSKKLGRKDMVKVEGRELNSAQVDKIALLAPHATISIIKNFEVIEKKRVHLPETIGDIVRCNNPSCISNDDEPVKSKFYVLKQEPLLLKCHYCGYLMEKDDVLKQF